MNPVVKLWLWVTAILAAAMVVLAPTPTLNDAANKMAGEGWRVPRISLPDEKTPQIVASLQRANLWGGQADTVVSTDDRASQWRLAGVTGAARERVVLVQFGDNRILPLKAGEKFPDGTPIAEVRENGVCVSLSGKRRFLPLSGQTVPTVW